MGQSRRNSVNSETVVRSRRAPNRNLEHWEQVKFFDALRILQAQGCNEAFLPFAVPNGSNKSSFMANWFKAEGLKAGVPDIIVPAARRGYNGLAIELKIRPNGLTDEQSKWRNRLFAENWLHVVAYSASEAWKIFCYYFEQDNWLYLLQ